MSLLWPELEKLRPDRLIVYGDTNSTVAAALVKGRLNICLAHLEVGLKSFNRRVPKEIKRVLTDHASDLCLASSQVAFKNLKREGLAQRAAFARDVMVDVLYKTPARRGIPTVRAQRTLRNHLIAKVHGQENTDNEDSLRAVLAMVNGLPLPVRLFTHPRLVERMLR